MIFTIGYLGGANYPKIILNNHPSGWGAGFILNTNKPFWPKTNCWGVINKLGARSDFPALKIHAVWKDDHTYDPKEHNPIINKEFDLARKFKNRHHSVASYFSPMCERDNRNQAVIDLFGRLKDKADGLIILNSYAKGGAIDGIMGEVHGTMAPPSGSYSFSFDGKQCFDADMEGFKQRHLRAELFEIWFSMCNGKYTDKAKGTKGADETPRSRRLAWPIGKHIKSVVPYAAERGAIEWRDNWIYKTHADQHSKTKPSPREGKPVMIIPQHGNVDLVTDNGTVIARLSPSAEPYKAPGSPQNGWSIYRAAEWGFELLDKARSLQGHPIVTVRVDGNAIGKINPAWRCGVTR